MSVDLTRTLASLVTNADRLDAALALVQACAADRPPSPLGTPGPEHLVDARAGILEQMRLARSLAGEAAVLILLQLVLEAAREDCDRG